MAGVVPRQRIAPGEIESQCVVSSQWHGLVVSMTQYLRYTSYANVLIVCFAIVFLKSSQDIIERINTLDYLLKVSVFQRNRLGLMKGH